jgi:hypothetical protein
MELRSHALLILPSWVRHASQAVIVGFERVKAALPQRTRTVRPGGVGWASGSVVQVAVHITHIMPRWQHRCTATTAAPDGMVRQRDRQASSFMAAQPPQVAVHHHDDVRRGVGGLHCVLRAVAVPLLGRLLVRCADPPLASRLRVSA